MPTCFGTRPPRKPWPSSSSHGPSPPCSRPVSCVKYRCVLYHDSTCFCQHACLQIQAELGWGHHNVIKAYEAILTPTHFALVMEFASGGSLTSYVSERFSKANTTGLFLNEDEARYFFRVRVAIAQ